MIGECDLGQGQVNALFVDALLCLMCNVLPIGQTVNQNGLESYQDKLADKDARSQPFHPLALPEREAETDGNGDHVVPNQGDPYGPPLEVEASNDAFALLLQYVEEEAD